ncbi:MAG: FAD-dependent monooxygenase [Planctomycetota bacterium]|nr:FAD-dependent monooxygenase [Planctomycetota bacterium]
MAPVMEQILRLIPSITIQQAAQDTWDAIVIGAGPAGAVAARQLAVRGLRVLLVERRSWPRHKVCGGCLNGRAISMLEDIGLSRVLENVSAVPLDRLHLQTWQRCVELKLPGGKAINRSQFDAAIMEAAIEAGVTFIADTTALIAPQVATSDFRQVKLSHSNEKDVQVSAKLVIAADGLGHPSLRDLPEFACHANPGSRVGLSTTVENLNSSYLTGVIYMAVSASGYVGLVRTAGGQGNLAAAIDSSVLKTAVETPDVVRQILTESGLPLPTFSSSNVWRGTIPLTRHTNRLSSHRVLLIGDAAGYTEPFTGEGIGWALKSAVAITPLAMRSIASWDPDAVSIWETNQKRQMVRSQIFSRTAIGLLRRPLAVYLTIGLLRMLPALARPLVRQVYQSQHSIDGKRQ